MLCVTVNSSCYVYCHLTTNVFISLISYVLYWIFPKLFPNFSRTFPELFPNFSPPFSNYFQTFRKKMYTKKPGSVRKHPKKFGKRSKIGPKKVQKKRRDENWKKIDLSQRKVFPVGHPVVPCAEGGHIPLFPNFSRMFPECSRTFSEYIT